jgi:hypothetical protein
MSALPPPSKWLSGSTARYEKSCRVSCNQINYVAVDGDASDRALISRLRIARKLAKLGDFCITPWGAR